VYCAGIGEFLDVTTFSAERRVFEVNLLGAVATLEVVIPAMIRAGKGHFIGLSSLADVLIDPVAPSYAASKAGLTSYLEAIALACRPRGVHVTNLRFGFVDTKMAKAPIRPLMMTPEQAAERILHCIRKRPVRDSFPRRMALLVRLLGFLSRFRGRLA
jgi:short-subunit dehydrogenase